MKKVKTVKKVKKVHRKDKVIAKMLDPNSGEIIYASNGSDEVHESDTGNEEDNNLESTLRRRKGKIISCAKETIEHGKFRLIQFILLSFSWDAFLSLFESLRFAGDRLYF